MTYIVSGGALNSTHSLTLCPSSTPGYASCILFKVFHTVSFLSYLQYFSLCTMSLFFIQQYIVAKTSQFLTEIQTTISSSPITLTLTQHLLVNLSHAMSWLTSLPNADFSRLSTLTVALGKPTGVPRGGVQTPPIESSEFFLNCVCKIYCPSSAPILMKS